jgi:hypothetical protein
LWPEKSDQEALVNLRQTLYLLRQSLPDAVEATRAMIGLGRQIPLHVDVSNLKPGLTLDLPVIMNPYNWPWMVITGSS